MKLPTPQIPGWPVKNQPQESCLRLEPRTPILMYTALHQPTGYCIFLQSGIFDITLMTCTLSKEQTSDTTVHKG
jgi:hypothetical protein